MTHDEHSPPEAGPALRIGVDGRVMQDRYHGIGRHTYELVHRLADRPVELVIFRDPRERGRLDVESLARRPRVRLVDFPVPVTSPAAQLRWPRVLAATAPDVLLVPYHLATPWIHPRVPTVTFVHDCIIESASAYAPGGRAFRRAYRTATRLALARTTAVATISHATREDLWRVYGVALPDDAVVPHGVGEQFLLPARRRPTRPGGTAERYVLHVGVHRPHKNVEVLVEAFAQVARRLPGVRLVLVGRPDPRFPGQVRDAVERHGLTGLVDLRDDVSDVELLRLYHGASAFAFPSRIEGFGLPVLEAMAAGVPTVTSTAPAVLEAAGGASVAVSPDDAGAWADALVAVLDDPALAAAMVRTGRQVALASTWGGAADRLLRLLERVAHGSPREVAHR